VSQGGSDDDLVASLQVLDDVLVGVLDVLSRKVGDLLGQKAALVDRARGHLVLGDDAGGDTDAVIVVTKGRSLLNDTGTRSVGDVGVRQDAESATGVLERGKDAG
jgi:hypothetical protein